MSDITFSAESWLRAGRAYQEAGDGFVAGVQDHLSGLSVEALGCHQGGHLVDMALSLVVPAVKEAFEAACADLADNMGEMAAQMGDTGDRYQQLELAQASLADSIAGEG